MKYYQFQPSGKLAAYVKYFWAGEAAATTKKHFKHIATAASSCKMVFHYKGRFQAVLSNGERHTSCLAGIQGASSLYANYEASENTGIFGIAFQPYAIPCFFGMPATTITHQYIDLHAFLGAKAAVLEEQLMSAAGNRQRVIIATRFLESSITTAPHPVIAEALRRIHQSKGMISMDMLTREFSFSQRQFERVFKAANGLTPKLYARILRFEHTLHKYRTGDPLTSLALQAGYFDQAHFIHDFKEFTGMAPATYFNAVAGLPPVQDTMSKIYNSR